MKLLAKFGLTALLGGLGATALYADSSGMLSADVEAAVKDGQAIHVAILADAEHVQQLRQLAHSEKDVIKLNCVNDKLVQLKPQVNIADQSQSEIPGSPDVAAVLTRLREAADNIRHLRESADACVGKVGLAGEGSSNSFTAPTGIYDPTATNPWGATLEPPVYASPITP